MIIINEMIEMMAHSILRGILVDIRGAKFFAIIIADETQDISHEEQLSISIRWVDEAYIIHEDVIGFVAVAKTDGATLANVIKDVLTRSQLQLSDCCGQGYDGASNMSGCFQGVASRLKSEEPSALYVHCSAHCPNLCLQNCSSKFLCIRDALSLTTEILQTHRND